MKGSIELRLLECETILKFLETTSGGVKEKAAAVHEILTRNSILLEGGIGCYFEILILIIMTLFYVQLIFFCIRDKAAATIF